MQNLSWINISMNSKGQWKCEYKSITKTYPKRYRRYEALSRFKDYLKEVLEK